VRIFAYCDQRYAIATRKAVGSGARLVTSPPLQDEDARDWAQLAQEADLIYFNLHAALYRSEWFTTPDPSGRGQADGTIALRHETLRRMDFRRGIVFMVNCYAGGAMLDALEATQPRAIVGGYGENLGGQDRLAGADMLGLWFRRGLQWRLGYRAALALGKARLRFMPRTPSVKDALQFEVLYAGSHV
jgi:hypothetical protein